MAPTRSDCCSHETSSGPPWMRITTMCVSVYFATPCTVPNQQYSVAAGQTCGAPHVDQKV